MPTVSCVKALPHLTFPRSLAHLHLPAVCRLPYMSAWMVAEAWPRDALSERPGFRDFKTGHRVDAIDYQVISHYHSPTHVLTPGLVISVEETEGRCLPLDEPGPPTAVSSMFEPC